MKNDLFICGLKKTTGLDTFHGAGESRTKYDNNEVTGVVTD